MREHYTCVAVLYFTNLNPDFALGSFRLVSESRFRFCFIQRHCFLIAILNVLVHQVIDKQANVIHTPPLSNFKWHTTAFKKAGVY